MSEQQETFSDAVAESQDTKPEDKVYWLKICCQDYLAKRDAAERERDDLQARFQQLEAQAAAMREVLEEEKLCHACGGTGKQHRHGILYDRSEWTCGACAGSGLRSHIAEALAGNAGRALLAERDGLLATIASREEEIERLRQAMQAAADESHAAITYEQGLRDRQRERAETAMREAKYEQEQAAQLREQLKQAEQRIEDLRQGAILSAREVEQTLGKALGYPLDPAPEGEVATTVCVGDHVPETIAAEAADRIRRLQQRIATLEPILKALQRMIHPAGAMRRHASVWLPQEIVEAIDAALECTPESASESTSGGPATGAVMEAARAAYRLLTDHYPLIAGRVTALEWAGETVTHEQWVACTKEWHQVKDQLRQALAALEKETRDEYMQREGWKYLGSASDDA